MRKDGSNFNRFTIELNNRNDTPNEVKVLIQLKINDSSLNDSLSPTQKETTTMEKSVD